MNGESGTAYSYAPVSTADRINTVDVLRGFALLGILLMNVVTFGLPMAAYFNPKVAGGDTGANLWAWILQYVLFDGRMRGIFSLMFGISIFLMITRAEKRGQAAGIADIHYRRMLWLLLFGVAHAYLIWFGDILYPYALMGLVLYPMRKFSPRALFTIAAVQFVILTAMSVGQGFEFRSLRDKAAEADRLASQGKTLTEEQKKDQEKWKETMNAVSPPPEEVKKEISAYGGNYLTALQRRAKEVIKWHSLPFYFPMYWDMLGMMLIGIALFKMGVITGERSTKFYALLAAGGLILGIPVNALAAWQAVQSRFEPLQMPFVTATYQVARVAVTVAYAALLIWIVKAGAIRWLTSRLQAVGQMAFSNYISHSIICSLVFYGYGFGLIGKLERYQLYYVVAAIWIFQLIVSPIWLRHFYFGPLEWGWRSLTYWQKQPFRIKAPEPAPEAAVEAQA